MSKTYKTLGLNLKITPMGESDRLLTILSPEQGMFKAIAVGSRKPKAKLGGRTNLFIVNELVLIKGRNFDRIIQAETVESYPGFSQNLGKLASGQYLLELTLGQALRDHAQVELFAAVRHHLKQIELSDPPSLYPRLTQACFHLLTLAGVAPEVYQCCRTRQPIHPNFSDRYWRVGFSIPSGGIISLNWSPEQELVPPELQRTVVPLTAAELTALQDLALGINPPDSVTPSVRLQEPSQPYRGESSEQIWCKLEQLLRDYAQHHLEYPLRSADLLKYLDAAQPQT